MISPRYSSVKRSIIQGIEICQVLNPATDSEGEKGENIGNEYLPAYIMLRKAGIVLHPDTDRSFVRLYIMAINETPTFLNNVYLLIMIILIKNGLIIN